MTNSCDLSHFMPSNHLYIRESGSHSAGTHVRCLRRDGRCTESGNMPAWAAHDSRIFWDAADQHERKNGNRYKEVVVTIPRALNEGQRADLVRKFVQSLLGERHAFTWTIHDPLTRDRFERPHVHVMFTERENDSIARGPREFFRSMEPCRAEKRWSRQDPLPHHETVCVRRARRMAYDGDALHAESRIEAQFLRLIDAAYRGCPHSYASPNQLRIKPFQQRQKQ